MWFVVRSYMEDDRRHGRYDSRSTRTGVRARRSWVPGVPHPPDRAAGLCSEQMLHPSASGMLKVWRVTGNPLHIATDESLTWASQVPCWVPELLCGATLFGRSGWMPARLAISRPLRWRRHGRLICALDLIHDLPNWPHNAIPRVAGNAEARAARRFLRCQHAR